MMPMGVVVAGFAITLQAGVPLMGTVAMIGGLAATFTPGSSSS